MQIRAQTSPYPGAYVLHNNEKLYLLETIFDNLKTTDKNSGTIIETTARGGALIACGSGSVLEILRVKPSGKPSMWAKDYFTNSDCENILS